MVKAIRRTLCFSKKSYSKIRFFGNNFFNFERTKILCPILESLWNIPSDESIQSVKKWKKLEGPFCSKPIISIIIHL